MTEPFDNDTPPVEEPAAGFGAEAAGFGTEGAEGAEEPVAGTTETPEAREWMSSSSR